jgi:hypothetical protein
MADLSGSGAQRGGAVSLGTVLAVTRRQEELTMPLILWLLGVPLSVIIVLLLLRVI